VLLLDNSAWSRIEQNILDEKRKTMVADWYERRELATCLPFLLEAGYSAQSSTDHKERMADLTALPHVPVTPEIECRAQEAQRELAEVGHHRLTPMDLIIAACAESQGAGVLHYDRDYDILSARTTLEFASEWVAPAGSL
jgi:predicted nucleic acid-binding protein